MSTTHTVHRLREGWWYGGEMVGGEGNGAEGTEDGLGCRVGTHHENRLGLEPVEGLVELVGVGLVVLVLLTATSP